MQAWEEKYFEREEGREEGRTEGERLKLISQIQKKILRGKSERKVLVNTTTTISQK